LCVAGICSDRLRQPCRHRPHLRLHVARGTVAAIPSRSVMHPSACTSPSVNLTSYCSLSVADNCLSPSVHMCVSPCVCVCFGAVCSSCARMDRWSSEMDCGNRAGLMSRQAGAPRGTVAAIFHCTACLQPACSVPQSCTQFMRVWVDRSGQLRVVSLCMHLQIQNRPLRFISE
jgi:hypothetical protein